MVGALFIYPMFKAIVSGNKTQTSRFGEKQQWKEGQRLYIKEPVCLSGIVGADPAPDQVIYQKADARFTRVEYAWENGVPTNNPDVFWVYKPKLFCPEKAARYFLQVKAVERKRLGDFTTDDYQREGLKRNLSWPIPTLAQAEEYIKRGGLDPSEKPNIEWSLELANDLVKTDRDPVAVWEYLLKLTDKKFVYDPDRWAWVYQFKLTEK